MLGMTGLFGKWISLSAFAIVCGRAGFAAGFLGCICMTTQKDKLRINPVILLNGCLLAIHWIAFYYSIQISTVTIGLLSFSVFPIFLVVIDSLIMKVFRYKDILLVALTVTGIIILLLPDIYGEIQSIYGLFVGLFGAFIYAIITLLNSRYIKSYSASRLSFWQNAVAFVILIPFNYTSIASTTLENLFLIIILGIIFTGVSHTIFINGMKFVNAKLASQINTLELLYGVLLACILLKEYPSIFTFIGGTIMMVSIILSSWIYSPSKNA